MSAPRTVTIGTDSYPVCEPRKGDPDGYVFIEYQGKRTMLVPRGDVTGLLIAGWDGTPILEVVA